MFRGFKNAPFGDIDPNNSTMATRVTNSVNSLEVSIFLSLFVFSMHLSP